MELTKHYDPDALAAFRAGQQAFINEEISSAETKAAIEKMKRLGVSDAEDRAKAALAQRYAQRKRPACTHVSLVRTSEIQDIPSRYIRQLEKDGVASIKDGKVVFKTGAGDQDVVYEILLGPGYYCLYCDSELDGQTDAREHILTEHQDDIDSGKLKLATLTDDNKLPPEVAEMSPAVKKRVFDQVNNPSGYIHLNGYRCRFLEG